MNINEKTTDSEVGIEDYEPGKEWPGRKTRIGYHEKIFKYFKKKKVVITLSNISKSSS